MNETDEDMLTALARDFGPVGARLRCPQEEVTLDAFLTMVRGQVLTVRLRGMAGFAGEPGLPGRIRGAFGDALAAAASPEARAGRPCPWQPPCAFEAVWRKQGRMTGATEFPSPWLIDVRGLRGDLIVSLTLFGMACDWMPAASEALTACLARVRWAGQDRFVPRLEIVSRRLSFVPSPVMPGTVRAVVFDVVTPLVSSGEGAARDPVAVFTALGWRLEGMARWHDVSLAATDWLAVAQDLRALDWSWDRVEPVSWRRGSLRQDRVIPMEGVVGRLRVSGMPKIVTRLMPLFHAGRMFRVGADIAFGCGVYEMTEEAAWQVEQLISP